MHLAGTDFINPSSFYTYTSYTEGDKKLAIICLHLLMSDKQTNSLRASLCRLLMNGMYPTNYFVPGALTASLYETSQLQCFQGFNGLIRIMDLLGRPLGLPAPVLIEGVDPLRAFKPNGWSFINNQNSGILVSGWSDPEVTHRWSEGPSARVILALPEGPPRELRLIIDGEAFVHWNHLIQPIELLINEQRVDTLIYEELSNGIRTIAIPAPIAFRNGDLGVMHIVFNFVSPTSPKASGVSADPRVLGLALKSLQLLG
jgi:hypothetical protein